MARQAMLRWVRCDRPDGDLGPHIAYKKTTFDRYRDSSEADCGNTTENPRDEQGIEFKVTRKSSPNYP